MLHAVFHFLDTHLVTDKMVLVALSGGVDSMCLFHIVCAWQAARHAHIGVIHVDHGWRQESRDEAEALRLLCKKHKIPFYHKTCAQDEFTGNLELSARKIRYDFFRYVVKEEAAQGILLAHHMNDQVETVFKRLLEGVKLSYLSGMTPISHHEDCVLFRPLLSFSKKEIEIFAEEHKLVYFHDATNRDTRFLRARLRHEIFPYLRAHFGKEFEKNLVCISKEAQVLRAYFNEKMKPFIDSAVRSTLGVFWDLSSVSWHPLEWHEFLRLVAEETKSVLSRVEVEMALRFLSIRSANKWVHTSVNRSSHVSWYCDRGRLFVLFSHQFKEMPTKTVLQLGLQQVGHYDIFVEPCDAIGETKNSWIDLFTGSCVTYLPAGNYEIKKTTGSLVRVFQNGRKRRFARCTGEKQIPHVMQTYAPLICVGDDIYEDFLLNVQEYLQESIEKKYFKVKVTFSR